ncbi:MAG: acyl carrier protein [Saccharofermentanales bacterium]|nr:acyl carrier protein [Eubacteriales bacterium]MDD3611002.1 acyl carrier protein [Eubacteriales bacterium]HHU03642.1 acyl carrier protein [Fastidiosipila sp.]
MDKKEIFERVQGLLAEQLSIEEETVEMSSNFVDDLNADSLDIVELIMTLEQEFNLTIPDEEAERIRTVGDAVDFIARSF